MKYYAYILFVLCFIKGFGQQTFDNVNTTYEEFLDRIAQKDTLIKNVTKRYKCSESFSGRLELYYEAKELRLIQHIYSQGFRGNVFLEDYFIEKDTLRLKTSITEIVRMNTRYVKSSQGVSSTTLEKVLEVIENRMLFDKNGVASCYERRDDALMSEWNQKHFETITFKKADCVDDMEDIRYKYRLLKKAEKKLIYYSNREPNCIFHIW